jgi:hypothetical protein
MRWGLRLKVPKGRWKTGKAWPVRAWTRARWGTRNTPGVPESAKIGEQLSSLFCPRISITSSAEALTVHGVAVAATAQTRVRWAKWRASWAQGALKESGAADKNWAYGVKCEVWRGRIWLGLQDCKIPRTRATKPANRFFFLEHEFVRN